MKIVPQKRSYFDRTPCILPSLKQQFGACTGRVKHTTGSAQPEFSLPGAAILKGGPLFVTIQW